MQRIAVLVIALFALFGFSSPVSAAGLPDLAITIQESSTGPGTVTYLITVTNIGTAVTPSGRIVTMRDTPAAGTSIQSWANVSSNPAVCSMDYLGRGWLQCDMSHLWAPGRATTIEVTVATPSSGAFTNVATTDVYNRIVESNEANNSASITTVVP